MSKKHNSIEIEKAILGLLISDPDKIETMLGYIEPQDFFEKKHQIIFQVLSELSEKNIKIENAAIINKLKEMSKFEEIGKEAYIAELIIERAIPSNLNKFMKILIDKSHLREVKRVVGSLGKDLEKEDADAQTLIERVENEILSTTRDSDIKEFEHASKIIKNTLKNIEERQSNPEISGIATNWKDFDDITTGLQKGDLVILAARPSMGKTAFALNIAATASKKHSVAFFSLEMPKEQLMSRILSSESLVDGYRFRTKGLTSTDWEKMNIAEEKISKMDLFIDDQPGLTLAELMWKAKRHNKLHPLDLIVIDYMQLISGPRGSTGDNRQAEVSAISRGLKQLARELNIPVIALSQLSRRVEQREDKRPMMSDIRESGAIEQDADLIAFLYRAAYYNRKENEQDDDSVQDTEVIISKHRNGSTGIIKLSFNPAIGKFSNKPRGEN